jgi:hypothetical protein
MRLNDHCRLLRLHRKRLFDTHGKLREARKIDQSPETRAASSGA